MERAVIVEGARTPIGRFLGSFCELPTVELGVLAAREAMRRATSQPDQVDQTIFGHARQAGNGPNTGRQVSVKAGVPVEVSAYNVNIACGSGMKAVQLAAQQIALGDSEVVLAGGMENMTRVPFLLDRMRTGYRMGDADGARRDVPRRPPRPAVRPDHGRDRREPRRPVRHLARGAGRVRARVAGQGRGGGGRRAPRSSSPSRRPIRRAAARSPSPGRAPAPGHHDGVARAS